MKFFSFKKKTKPGVETNEENLGDIVFIVVFWPFLLILLGAVFIVHLVNEYIVTPAVSGNGSATLGNFALAKDVADKHANK